MVLDPAVDEVRALLPAGPEALLERALDHPAQPEDLRLGDDRDDAQALSVAARLAVDRALVAQLVGQDVGLDDELVRLGGLVVAALLVVAELRSEELCD